MPPIRADHRCIRKSGSASVPEVEERAKQPRRSAPLTKRNSPSHSRTPSPNQQAPPSSTIATVHAATAYGHVGARRSPSSKAGGSTSRSVFPDSSGGGSNATMSGPREKRSADQTRKGYNLPHAHSQRGLGSKSPAFGPPHKVAATRSSNSSSGGAGAGASWGASSPTPAGGSGSRASSSPTPTPASVSSSARGHSSPTLSRVIDAATAAAAADGLQQATAATSSSSAVCTSAAVMMTLGSASTMAGGSGSAAGSGSGAAGLAAASRQPSPSRAEAREMTLLDRVFLEQPHEGRVDVEGDDLHVSNEIQRHLKTRVQSQQSQRMEATIQESSTASSSSAVAAAAAAAILQQQQQQQHPLPISNVPAVVGSSAGGGGFLDHHSPDHLLAPAGVTPVSPSSGSGPVQGGQMDLDVGAGLSLGPMDYLLTGSDKGNSSSSRQGGVGVGGASNRDSSSPSRGGPRSRSPPPTLGPVPDIQMGEAGADGNLREVVSGFDAMDLDDLDNVDRALALLNAKKQWIIAKQYAEAQQAQQAQQQQHRNNSAAVVPPQPPPPQSSYGGSSRTGGGGGGSGGGTGGSSSNRTRRSSGRSSSNRHGGESSPSTAGGRSEAFGVSGGGGSVRGGGGGFMSSPVSYTSGRGPRGQQGRPPPVPGHLSASTAAMRRSSPGSIASLAELDSYLEHHHRRLVEQVEGVVADDVEAEIEASRQQHRRNPRSHRSFGAGAGTRSHNGSCSSGSSVPRTVGAGVTTKCFFDSTLSADGYNDYNAGDDDDDDSSDYRGQQQQQQQQHQHRQHQRVVSSERSGSGSGSGSGNGNGNGDQRTSSSRGWDPPNQRGPGYKRDRDRVEADGGWGATLRGFRGGNNANRGGGGGDVDVDSSRGGGSSAFMGVSGGTSQTSTSSPPPSIMSSDDVSVSSYGHPVTVLPGSPNNIHFNGRPPPSLAKIRLEAVRSPAVRRGSRSGAGTARSGRGGSGGGGGGGGGGGMHNGGPIFTSPDASKHVHELCSPRSAFTPRSASSVSSLASSRGRR